MSDLDDYLNAPSGVGPLAWEWKDKPHRLLYDLLRRIDTAVSLCNDSPAGSVMEAAAVTTWLDEIRSALTIGAHQHPDRLDSVGSPESANSEPRCTHRFPLPMWMSEEQGDPCRCDLRAAHTGAHSCEHLRGKND